METKKVVQRNPNVMDFYNGLTLEQYEKSGLKWRRLRALEHQVMFALEDGRFDDIQKLLDQYKIDPSVFL